MSTALPSANPAAANPLPRNPPETGRVPPESTLSMNVVMPIAMLAQETALKVAFAALEQRFDPAALLAEARKYGHLQYTTTLEAIIRGAAEGAAMVAAVTAALCEVCPDGARVMRAKSVLPGLGDTLWIDGELVQTDADALLLLHTICNWNIVAPDLQEPTLFYVHLQKEYEPVVWRAASELQALLEAARTLCRARAAAAGSLPPAPASPPRPAPSPAPGQ